MPRPRKPENRGLPTRWRLVHGAYYFQVPPGLEAMWEGKKQFRLGVTLPEAYRTWAARLGSIDKARNIGQLFDRYALEVVPAKGAKSRADNVRYITKLRAVFGALALEDMKPQLIYQFADKAKAKVAAHRALAVLSHAFTKAVEWGYIDRHPFKGEVRLAGEPPRTRYVEDWEIVECLALASRRKKGSVRMVQAYIRIKLLTGIAKGDLLRLRPEDFQNDGIHIQRRKTIKTTGKRTIYEWSPELRVTIDAALATRPVHIAPWLFCNKSGECYFDDEKETASGWDSVWQRFMARVLKETKVALRFTEHDLRAKCASDADTLEHARALLAHADARTTDRIYRRKAEKVKPLR